MGTAKPIERATKTYASYCSRTLNTEVSPSHLLKNDIS